jgi:hypothetical protein
MVGTGRGLMISGKEDEGPFPQELVPNAVIFPEDEPREAFTVTEFVPVPETIAMPAGKIQEKEVAFSMGNTE